MTVPLKLVLTTARVRFIVRVSCTSALGLSVICMFVVGVASQTILTLVLLFFPKIKNACDGNIEKGQQG